MLKNGGEVEREKLVEVKRSDGDTVTVLPYFYRRHIFHFYGFYCHFVNSSFVKFLSVFRNLMFIFHAHEAFLDDIGSRTK